MRSNSDSFFHYLTRLNQVLFVFFFAINVYWVYYSWKDRQPYEEKQVSVIAQKDPEAEKKLAENLDYVLDRKNRDVLIFKVLNTAVVAPPETLASEKLEMVADGNGVDTSPQTVNLLFVKEGGNSRKLFGSNVFISSYRLASTKEEFEKNTYEAFSKNLYTVISKDSNGDGVLNKADGLSLYASDYDGQNCVLLVENFVEHRITGWNQLVLKTKAKDKVSFSEYNAESGKLNPISLKD